jgi:hypothetical protein
LIIANLKGYFHLEFLKEKLPLEYGGLSYARIFLTGSFYKAPILMWPFIRIHRNLSNIEAKKYFLAVAFTIAEVLILLNIIISP